MQGKEGDLCRSIQFPPTHEHSNVSFYSIASGITNFPFLFASLVIMTRSVYDIIQPLKLEFH